MIEDIPSPRCYVAAPYADGGMVRDRILARVLAAGWTPYATWLTQWSGPEDLSQPVEVLRRQAELNDLDLRQSHVVLVLAREGVGGEMFAEAARALEWGKAVVWCGRRTLSAFRRGVVRVDDLDEAVAVLKRMRDVFEEGARGELLSVLGGAS